MLTSCINTNLINKGSETKSKEGKIGVFFRIYQTKVISIKEKTFGSSTLNI